MARKKNLSHNERAAKANRLRESGQPGGSQDRKDEVGRSGVYPMSEPHAPRPVEIRTAGLKHSKRMGTALPPSHRPAMSKFRPRSGSHFLTASAGSTRAGWPTS